MKLMLAILLFCVSIGYGQEIEVTGNDPPPPKYRISAFQNDLGEVQYFWEYRHLSTTNGWKGAPWYRATYCYITGHIKGFKTYDECKAALDAEVRQEQANNWKRIE